MTQTVLITGGGGFLGHAIVRRFLQAGWNVRSISRTTHHANEALGITSYNGDLARDIDTLTRAAIGCDVVVHCAAKAGVWGNRDTYYRANVIATQNVVQACQTARVKALVHTSSPSVVFTGTDLCNIDETAPYPATFPTHYTETKALAEQLALAANTNILKVCALRPHCIWGEGDPHFLPRLWNASHRLRTIGNGQNLVDCVYHENAADAHYCAALSLLNTPEKSAGKPYFITNNEPVNLTHFINQLLAIKHLPPITRTISLPNALRIAKTLEFAYRTLRLKSEPPITQFVAKELATSHYFNTAAATHDLGYTPKITMAQGLERLAKWANNQ